MSSVVVELRKRGTKADFIFITVDKCVSKAYATLFCNDLFKELFPNNFKNSFNSSSIETIILL